MIKLILFFLAFSAIASGFYGIAYVIASVARYKFLYCLVLVMLGAISSILAYPILQDNKKKE